MTRKTGGGIILRGKFITWCKLRFPNPTILWGSLVNPTLFQMFSYTLLFNTLLTTLSLPCFLDWYYISYVNLINIFDVIMDLDKQYLKIIKDALLCCLYIKMPRTHRDQHTGTNIEMHIKTFYELRPDLKICWFSVTRLGLQETCRSKIFSCSFLKKFVLVSN